MSIFEDGKTKCPPDSFTLGDGMTQEKLEINVTMESIAAGHDNLCLYCYSCSYYIQRQEGSNHSEYKTFANNAFHIYPYWSNVISQQLGQARGRRVQSPLTLPGGTVKYY